MASSDSRQTSPVPKKKCCCRGLKNCCINIKRYFTRTFNKSSPHLLAILGLVFGYILLCALIPAEIAMPTDKKEDLKQELNETQASKVLTPEEPVPQQTEKIAEQQTANPQVGESQNIDPVQPEIPIDSQ